LLHYSAIGSPTAGLGPRLPDPQTPRPPDPRLRLRRRRRLRSKCWPALADWLAGWLAADYAALASGGCFPQARSCKSWSWWRLLEATGGSLVQLGPIVRPLPFPRPRAASYSYISSFLLLHPPSHCTAPHRTALLENPPTQDKRLLFELLSHLGLRAFLVHLVPPPVPTPTDDHRPINRRR